MVLLCELSALPFSFREALHHLLADSMGWHSSLVHMPYGERLHKHRRWIMDYFGEQAIVGHRYIQREGIARMLLGLLETPTSYEEHLKMLVSHNQS
jgi:hypothetical protein